MTGNAITALKDDRCNTKVVPKDFVLRYGHVLNKKTNMKISDSMKNIVETYQQMVQDPVLELGNHTYASKWNVSF